MSAIWEVIRMIQINNVEVIGWEHAIRGMRNPLNSWDKSDTVVTLKLSDATVIAEVGDNDHELMMKLACAGSDHAKYRRMITVYLDITAPLYWWKEFDTYKVGTVTNSCSTMHTIHTKEFTLDDFSHDHLTVHSYVVLSCLCDELNTVRKKYLETKDKKYWWQMIQLLPSSYNQKRTVMLNYEVLANMWHSRKNHKLTEWVNFCKWIESLPYSEIITGGSRT